MESKFAEPGYLEFLDEIDPAEFWYIHKHEVALQYGGPEEGGWWYTAGSPAEDWNPADHAFGSEIDAVLWCRKLNEDEDARAKREEQYDFHSVNAYLSQHFSYSVEEHAKPYYYPHDRPHYE